jgi:hypothetical protein
MSDYLLPKSIEKHLAALSKFYAAEGNRRLQELIVNSQIRISEGWSRDNWDGGTYGHALFLVLPESIFLSSLKDKDNISAQIREDINKIHSVQNEFIQEVFIEMQAEENGEWRRDSGLLASGKLVVQQGTIRRIWGGDRFRVFLSHKSEVKHETATLKDELKLFGITCFVAHEDIEPTAAWQDEIQNALASMDGFVALMTEKFHDSNWTDQEVGYAVARGVPIIAARLGRDPYGFIGKFQGLACNWSTSAVEIAKILIQQEKMIKPYIGALRACVNFDSGNRLSKVLPNIKQLTASQIDELVAIYNENDQLRGSHGFSGALPSQYGDGLLPILNKLGRKQFRYAPFRKIEQIA